MKRKKSFTKSVVDADKLKKDVVFVRRSDLVNYDGTNYGKLHIRDPATGGGICYVSSQAHLNTFTKIQPHLEIVDSCKGKICKQCYAIYENKGVPTMSPTETSENITLNGTIYVRADVSEARVMAAKKEALDGELMKIDAVIIRRFKNKTQTDVRMVGVDGSQFWRPQAELQPGTVIRVIIERL